MKARVKETGIVLDVYPSHIIRDNVKEIMWYKTPQGACFTKDELEFIDTENNFDYWTRLEHTYAGMAMQGLIAGGRLDIALSYEIAHVLVQKLKEKEGRK